MALEFEHYDHLEWVEEESLYKAEGIFHSDNPFTVADVEKSLREQGFEDRSADYTEFDLALRETCPNIEIRINWNKDVMEVDFYGVKLSDMREIELNYSLLSEEADETDTLQHLKKKQINPSRKLLYRI